MIASHAKSGLSEFVLGSVAAHCMQHSRQPVLVLHAPQRQRGMKLSRSGVLDRLASAAANALGGGHPAGAGAAAETEVQQQDAASTPGRSSAGSGRRGRSFVLAVDDSGKHP